MKTKNKGVIMDSCLLGFFVVVLMISIFMANSPLPFFFNLVCLMITLILVIITYFTNIVTGLIFNLLFFFGQLMYVFYVSIYHNGFSLGYVFWLIIPLILCLLIFGITLLVREQAEENSRLRKNNARLNALDQETNLRTLTMFDEDYTVLSHVSDEKLNVLSMMVIQIRYWDSMKSIISNQQIRALIHLITEQVNNCYDDANFKYIIDSNVPTWGILTFNSVEELKVVRSRLKEDFVEKKKSSELLRDIKIELVISISIHDEETRSSTDMLAAGIRELQYDV